MSIRMAVQETANFDGLFAYLSAPNYAFHYQLSHGLIPRRSIIAAMRNEVSMFGIVQKEQRGFERAIETAKTKMQSYHAAPDTIIIAPELSLYITTVPEARIDYAKAGQPGVDEFQKGAVGFGESQFRGLTVHKVLPFDVGEQGARTQMLQRVVQTGEFFRMEAGINEIVIFDEDKDGMTVVTRHDALASYFQLKYRETFFEDWATDGKFHLDTFKTSGMDADDDRAAEWTEAYDGDLTILRPWMEHTMMSAIITKAGPDTGLTFFGPSDMQIASHTGTKMIEGHYTCHTKSVVTKPENVCILENLMCTGYNGGGGSLFFTSTKELALRHELQLSPDGGEASKQAEVKSLLCVLGRTSADFCDLANRGTPWTLGEQAGTFPGTYADKRDADYALLQRQKEWGLHDILAGNDDDAARTQSFLSNGLHTNHACFVGSHRYVGTGEMPTGGGDKTGSSVMKGSKVHTVGQGHFGGDALPGDARWRRGEAVDMQSARAAISCDENVLFCCQ